MPPLFLFSCFCSAVFVAAILAKRFSPAPIFPAMKQLYRICLFLSISAAALLPQTTTPAKKQAAPAQSTAAKTSAPKTAPSPPASKSASASKSGSASKSAPAAHPASASSTAAKKTAPAATASKSGSAKSRRTGKAAPPPVASHRSQSAPTPDRYREIQQALAERGYLKSEPDGVWSTESAEALKLFQADHDLSPTGKLSSLSLIQLGLGPKHDYTATAATAFAAAQAASPAEPPAAIPPTPEPAPAEPAAPEPPKN